MAVTPMQVVILCGGKGTRLREHTEHLPKPLIEIGDKPILWHVMKIYAHFGFNDFVLCLGYLGDKIREFFCHSESDQKHWNITFAETGEETNTGGRIKRVEPHIHGDYFLATYADGLADINLHRLVEYHRAKGKLGTITALNPVSAFGILSLDRSNVITEFREKPRLPIWINGGFFVFNRAIFGRITDDAVLEQDVFEQLAREQQIVAFQHRGFWASMDTYKDAQELNRLWNEGRAPWKVWCE